MPWALISPSVWALAAGHVARFCASCAATYVLHPYRPRLSFDFRRLKALVPFTGWVMAMSVWSYVASVLDNVVVGGWLGPAALGLYSKGREIAYLPASPIANVVSKVSLSAYARLQHDRAKVQAGFLKALDLALLLALPFTALMIAQGDGIIAVALGAKWSGLVRPLQALCAAMVFRCLIEVTLPALEGLGRPDLRLRCELVQGIIALTLLYPAIRWHGALGAALAMTIATAAAWVYSADVARREFGVTLRAVASASWLPAACSLPLLLSRAAIDAGQLSRIGYATSLAAVAAGSAGLFFSVGAALGTGGYMTVRDLGARWSS